MIVAELELAELERRLLHDGLLLKISPFVVRIHSNIATLAKDIALVYADFDTASNDHFADFHVEVLHEKGLRRWFRPLARFYFDGQPSFVPLPLPQAFVMLEWGLNWCVAAHSHRYLIIHAAVVEKQGHAAIIPAPPGSGKSTLCSGLIQRGWRLLSDELALYDMNSGLVSGMARPVNLKNDSIQVIRNFEPDVVMTPPIPDTQKGTICLMRPPHDSVQRRHEAAKPTWVIVPRYQPGSAPRMQTYSPASAFMLLAEQSFNYEIHGLRGFEALGQLVDQCNCLEFTYSRLEDAETEFIKLLSDQLT